MKLEMLIIKGQPIAVDDETDIDDTYDFIDIDLLDDDTDPKGDNLILDGGIGRYIYDMSRCEELANDGNDYNDAGYTATIPYTIRDVRQPPIVYDDSDEVDQDSEQPQYGTATPVGNTGGNTYTPDPTQAQDKCTEIAAYYSDLFYDYYKYNIPDTNDNLVSNEALVTIKVMCNRDPPNANDVTRTTDENPPILIDVLDNDTDPEGDTDGLVIVSNTDPDRGTALIVNNQIEYTPDRLYI